MELNRDWNAKEMFDVYLYNHLRMRNMHKTAEEFKRESGLNTDREITPEGDFLREWWEIIYDIQSHSLQTRQQIPLQNPVEAEPVSGSREKNFNYPRVPEAGASQNRDKVPINLVESSKAADDHPAAASSNTELKDHQEINQFVGQFSQENIAAFTRRDQQQLQPLQVQDRLAKGKAIDVPNTSGAETDLFAAQEVAALEIGSRHDAVDSQLEIDYFTDRLQIFSETFLTAGSSINLSEVEDQGNPEKAAATAFSSKSSNRAENLSISSSFLKRKHDQWKSNLEGIVFDEFSWLRTGKNKLLSCHFSSNGKLLASAGHDKKVFIWDMDTFHMNVTPESHTHIISDVRFCPNSTVLATSSFDKTVEIWDANREISMGKLVGHTKEVTSVDFHPSEMNILCSSDIHGEIRLWDVIQGISLRVLKDSPRPLLTYRPGVCKQVRFNPQDGSLLAAALGNTIRIVDVETDSTRLYLEGHKVDVRAICWDPSGRYIAFVSEDSSRIFSIESGRCIHELHSDGYIFQSCTYHPKYSKLLVIGSYQSIGLWDHVQGRKSMNHCVHDNNIAALSALLLHKTAWLHLLAMTSVKIWK